jgi:HEAT repeat protein
MNRWFLGFAAAASLATSDMYLPLFTSARQADSIASVAPAPWLQGDPADSLYRIAREALSKNQYARAATLFAELVRKHPKSGYAGDALYWQAFAQYRVGGEDNLKKALAVLEMQRTKYPAAATRGDGEALATRIQGSLAREGDPGAAEAVIREGESATTPGGRAGPGNCDDESDVKMAALNAVLQMDHDRALPLLTRVLARRDPGSVCLRRKAVFLVAQASEGEAAKILVTTARNDPDAEVRQQAVFWLSQVNTPEAVAALDSIARRTGDADLQERAVFALAQQDDPRAAQALRDIAERKDVPRGVREKAIFWLGQSEKGGGEYLRGLFARLDDDDLKDKVIFGVAQSGKAEDRRWLLDVAKTPKSAIELRKKAIFWLGQTDGSAAELGTLYTSLTEPELKEQTIFAMAQLGDSSVVDRLVDIARKDKDSEMRKKAIFWLGQSDDPRAAQYIEQILND